MNVNDQRKVRAFLDAHEDDLLAVSEVELRAFLDHMRPQNPEVINKVEVILNERMARVGASRFTRGAD